MASRTEQTDDPSIRAQSVSSEGAEGGTPQPGAGSLPPALGDGQGGAADKKNKTRVALYLRVSTRGQTVENQERELREVADRAGWEVVAVYKDEGISGSKGRDKRPAFDAMLKDAVRRRFNMVASWSVDRLGRSLQHLIGFLSEIQGAGVDLYLHKQAIDTSTPAGKALFQMMGVFAEFERAMIVDRVNAGLDTARAKGKKLGRRKLPDTQRQAIRDELQKGTGINRTAALHGVGVLTVQRIKKELQ